MSDPAIERLIQKLGVYERNQRAMVDRVVALENKLGVTRVPVFETLERWPSQPGPQCTRRHLTEAEEALCEYAARYVVHGWTAELCNRLNIVRDERRQQTNGAEGSHTDRDLIAPSAPADPCSCDEALELRRKLGEMLDTIRKIDIEAHATHDYRQNMNRVRNLARAALKR